MNNSDKHDYSQAELRMAFEKSTDARVTKLKVTASLLDTAITIVISIAFWGLVSIAFKQAEKNIWSPPEQPPTLDSKINRLALLLSNAAAQVDGIEGEIRARQAVVADLQRTADTAQALAQLNQAQMEAVRLSLRGEIERDQREQAWWTFANNVGFALFGAAVGPAIAWVMRRRNRPSEPSPGT